VANQEHVDILRQGIEVWNKWRQEYCDVRPNLTLADLSGTDLSTVNLSGANLSTINLNGANLSSANLNDADLKYAFLASADLTGANLSSTRFYNTDLSHADLSDANLSGADLLFANLSNVDLYGANLRGASLKGTELIEANLSGADLRIANLSATNLNGADLSNATIGLTTFGNVNLSKVRGLETVQHTGPSTIGIEILYQSGGNIPEVFLKGAGVPDTFITYIRSLVGRPIEYYSCFISYSSRDQVFAERLYADLQASNVRCWYAPEDLKIGDKFRVRIDESIRLYDKLLLILSEHSVASPWVETEVEIAFRKENKTGKLALFPVKLDDTVTETDQPWTADIKSRRHIGDFTRWKDHDAYQHAFQRLLRDLKAQS
jgi:hypothetical protein